MGWLDEVPRAGGLYIGGLHALFQKQDLFKNEKITHIVSVLDYDLYEDNRFSNYAHYQVKIDDDPNQNLLQYFSKTNAFIESALGDGKGRVFVHCAMGKSRSATIVCAYLMYKFGVSASEALSQLCEGRPVCDPNPGFSEQLKIYSEMLKTKSGEERDRIYKHWLETRYTGTWYSDMRQQAWKL